MQIHMGLANIVGHTQGPGWEGCLGTYSDWKVVSEGFVDKETSNMPKPEVNVFRSFRL